jgi:hypothetical protein
MTDPTRHPTPTPDDAAVRRIIDALTAPATAEELADEARYLAMFTALAAPPPAPERRRLRGRLVLAGAAAALAVTGTAAAVTGTINRTTTPAESPPMTSATPPNTSAPPVGLVPSTPPAAPLPSATAGRSAPTRSTPSAPGRSVKPRPTPTPSPSPKEHKLPPESALRAYCRSYLEGKLKGKLEDSKKYRELVEAAGGADHVREYCEALVAADPHD